LHDLGWPWHPHLILPFAQITRHGIRVYFGNDRSTETKPSDGWRPQVPGSSSQVFAFRHHLPNAFFMLNVVFYPG
jgi:hypothetical protein